jgi:hypothetical protein
MKALYLFLAILFGFFSLDAQKIIDEDFTDGAVDDYGAGDGGANWHIVGNGMDFWSTNSRGGIGTALSHKVSLGGGGWAERADWYPIRKDSTYFQVHKYNDVAIVRMTTFSDYCYKNNFAGVEVAFLDYRSELAGHPHYEHDQSWETMACYYTSPGKGVSPNQLETNVENTDNPSPTAVKNAHYNGWYTKSQLDDTQTSLVIWRNMKDQKKVNVEQWGEANYGDFLLDTHMVALLDPTREYSVFSFIQVTFFRGIPSEPSSQWLLRDGVSHSNAQIGITHLEVGITKQSDFNLDYQTDGSDANILISNDGSTGTNAHIQSGDANNDDVVNFYDANFVTAFWNSTPGGTISASGQYNSGNGEITINLSNISYFELIGPAGVYNGAPGNLPSNDLFIDNDNIIGAFSKSTMTVSGHNVGAVAATGQSASDMYLVVNYQGSEDRDGDTIPLDGTEFLVNIEKIPDNKTISIYPNPTDDIITIQCTNCNNTNEVQIIDASGRTVLKTHVNKEKCIDISMFPAGVYTVILITNQSSVSERLIIE